MRTYQITQRPDYCTLNTASPLARGLGLGYFGCMGCSASTQYFDSSLNRTHSTFYGYSGSYTPDKMWKREIGRNTIESTSAVQMGGGYQAAAPNVSASSILSISFWLKRTSTSGTYETIISKRDTGANANYEAGLNTGTKALYFWGGGAVGASSYVPAVGSWIHVLWVAKSGSSKLWVNGKYIGDTGVGLGATNSNPIYLGGVFIFGSMGTATQILNAKVADRIIALNDWSGYVSEICDPSNVMYEVGGVPLLLPAWHRSYAASKSGGIPLPLFQGAV